MNVPSTATPIPCPQCGGRAWYPVIGPNGTTAAELCDCAAAKPIRDRIASEEARKVKAAGKRSEKRRLRKVAWVAVQRKAAAVLPPEKPTRDSAPHWSEPSSTDGL